MSQWITKHSSRSPQRELKSHMTELLQPKLNCYTVQKTSECCHHLGYSAVQSGSRRFIYGLHVSISQKMATFITTAVKTLNAIENKSSPRKHCHLTEWIQKVFGLVTGFIVHLQDATNSRDSLNGHCNYSTVFLICTSRYLVAAPNGGHSLSSGSPNYVRPRLPGSHFLQL
jgi:hypothetical protein